MTAQKILLKTSPTTARYIAIFRTDGHLLVKY